MQAYSDPKRENDPHALPDVEIFECEVAECSECGTENIVDDNDGLCFDCGNEVGTVGKLSKRWYWQACFPGCMPDSDPFGPFATEAEALADAQSSAEGN